ncbi:MAG: saccharopine dehydrogenase family protein [Solirubrobacterales bacterium]
MSDRDLDVVVFGATGVTGRRVAAYLAERAAETDLRWAAAARDADKVGKLLGEIGVIAPETIVADVGDGASLAAMASRARVVLDLVGPYTLYGRPVIEACVTGGAHYVDLTGEMPFVREIIADFDELASAAGVKIVQVCGFEALPPDLLIAAVAERAREEWGEGLAAADLEVVITPPPGPPRPSDGMSGGTFQSLSAVAASDEAALIDDPALLITDAEVAAAVRRVSPIELVPRRGSSGAVIAPMMPAPFINPAVIHRTAALLSSAEGRPADPFRYREGMALGGGGGSLAARWAIAGAMSGIQVGLRGLARARPSVRRPIANAMARIGPASGFGPAADRLEGWRWTMSVHARTTGDRELEVHLEADGHPGYLATARLLGEAGMLLAEDGATPERAGCLTPAVALGTACIGRFERAGMRVSVDG